MDYQVGDIVKTLNESNDRLEGVVKHITCFAATGSGGKRCDRNECNHGNKNFIWVKWPNGKLCSYSIGELEPDLAAEEDLLKQMEDVINHKETSRERMLEAQRVVKTIVKAQALRNAAPTQQKVAPMKANEDRSFMGMIKKDSVNAAYRVGARQINNGIRNAAVEVMKTKGADNSTIEGVTSFLKTEWGTAAIGMVAGHGLTYIPMIKDNPKAQRLAEEFRIASMTTAGNELVSMLLAALAPALQTVLASIPEETSSSLEGQKSSEEEMEIEVDVSDFNSLENHLEEEEERMVQNGK